MGYSLSFDASVKVKKAGVKGYLHHTAREVDSLNGKEVKHSNPDIHPERTRDNGTYFNNGGSFALCDSSEKIEQALNERLKAVKKPLRKDAVVMRSLILQLDPEWYKEHTAAQERMNAATCMLKWAVSTFGRENTICCSIHRDETNEHLHVGICPVTEDGRLSQKDWFVNPQSLREMHEDFRNHMKINGFDVDKERRKPGKHAKRMSEKEYKAFARLNEREAAADQRDRELEARQSALEARESALAAREHAVALKASLVQGIERDEDPAGKVAVPDGLGFGSPSDWGFGL